MPPVTALQSLLLATLIAATAVMARAQDAASTAARTPPATALAAPTSTPGAPKAARPDLSTSSEDLRITRNIRDSLQREVMDSDPLAIRIVTRKGAVTLSGAIKDAAERAQVEALVHGTPGAMTLTDRLQIP